MKTKRAKPMTCGNCRRLDAQLERAVEERRAMEQALYHATETITALMGRPKAKKAKKPAVEQLLDKQGIGAVIAPKGKK